MSDDQIDQLDRFEGSDAYDETEKAVLQFAEQLTTQADVDSEIIEQLKQTFDAQELVELAVTVGVANLTNRVNHAFDIPLEE